MRKLEATRITVFRRNLLNSRSGNRTVSSTLTASAMLVNVTKDKGDLGLISVMRDLELKGYKVCLPISEHLPFDLIALNKNMTPIRISVKYKKLTKKSIQVLLRSVYSNKKGSSAKTIDFAYIDGIAVYCPDIDKCFCLHVDLLKGRKSLYSINIENHNIQIEDLFIK